MSLFFFTVWTINLIWLFSFSLQLTSSFKCWSFCDLIRDSRLSKIEFTSRYHCFLWYSTFPSKSKKWELNCKICSNNLELRCPVLVNKICNFFRFFFDKFPHFSHVYNLVGFVLRTRNTFDTDGNITMLAVGLKCLVRVVYTSRTDILFPTIYIRNNDVQSEW